MFLYSKQLHNSVVISFDDFENKKLNKRNFTKD